MIGREFQSMIYEETGITAKGLQQAACRWQKGTITLEPSQYWKSLRVRPW